MTTKKRESSILDYIIVKDELLTLALAVYLGSVFQVFFSQVIQDVALPLLITIIPGVNEDNFNKLNFKLMDTPIYLGEVLLSFIKLLVAVVVVFFTISNIMIMRRYI